ncbi:MAG: cbb3-type cytochrome c oxidase subunit I [Acidimicrobiaceae bacterium]|nr:cbb3-type cytochrome c oxidase subunit I [Acidimicrobiaceae bacterium]
MTLIGAPPGPLPAEPVHRRGLAGMLVSTEHKTIGLLTIGTSMALFVAMGALALVMRSQLAQPDQSLVTPHVYDQLFTMHGSGMIYLAITPVAIGFGLYLVPLQIGAPYIAGARVAALGYWLYVAGAVSMLSGFAVGGGAAPDGWYAYTPLTTSTFTPGQGMDLWIVGVFLSAVGMMLEAGPLLWTALRLRAPGMTLLHMPVFTWSMVVTCLMVLASFPSLLVAMSIQALGRMDPSLFSQNAWNIGYQNLFWFYGHPVVYIMFFPFVGMVAEVLSTFSGRRYAGYKPTVISLLAFAALSMSVWGHHLFTTGQAANDYYSLTSISLSIPAGVEYFGFLATILGGCIIYRTPMLFALAFIPQFLVGGLSGIMLGTPVVDYHVNGSFFVVAHFHYTLFAGSVFGLFAGFYYWWPKATGIFLREGLGRLHFWLMVIGTNVTFGPMFAVGFMGMPRRVATYSASDGFSTINLVSSCGAAVLALSMVVFLWNVFTSWRAAVPAPHDPWSGQTLEWATSSPPPLFNFVEIPPVKSYAPLLDLRRSTDGAAVP